jgi:putative ATP-dependent endonuclease of OLD family
VAAQVTDRARELRAVSSTASLRAALNADSFQLSEGAVSLHVGAVPMERHGLGSRRLTGISVQLADSADARILLIDEVESGLEPFRIRHLLGALGSRLKPANLLSQVFVTTHSPVVLRELTYEQLGVVRRKKNVTEVLTPDKTMQRILRANAEAFLAPSVLICEGATEVGFAREIYANAEQKVPLLISSVATADANGESNLIEYADAFVDLGFRVAVFCDYDTTLDLSSVSPSATIIRSDQGKCTEQQILHSLSRSGLAAAIQHGIDALGESAVFATLSNHGCPETLARSILIGTEITHDDLKQAQIAVSTEASKGKNKSGWFKSVAGGERLAAIAIDDSGLEPNSPAARIIAELDNWGAQ